MPSILVLPYNPGSSIRWEHSHTFPDSIHNLPRSIQRVLFSIIGNIKLCYFAVIISPSILYSSSILPPVDFVDMLHSCLLRQIRLRHDRPHNVVRDSVTLPHTSCGYLHAGRKSRAELLIPAVIYT